MRALAIAVVLFALTAAALPPAADAYARSECQAQVEAEGESQTPEETAEYVELCEAEHEREAFAPLDAGVLSHLREVIGYVLLALGILGGISFAIGWAQRRLGRTV